MTKHQVILDGQTILDGFTKIRAWVSKPEPNISFGHRFPDWSSHSLEAMEDDGIDFMDLLRVLRTGSVTEAQRVDDEVRYVVQGSNLDGERFTLVVVLIDEFEEIELVTAWAG
jgi:hypothetical protein